MLVIIRDNTNNNFLLQPEKMNFKIHKNHVLNVGKCSSVAIL